MALNLILGRAGTGKTRRCLDAVRERLVQAPDGPPLLLIVPEQATFQAERELAATPGLGGFVRAHVMGFRRLAYRVLAETGGGAAPHLTDMGKRLVLRRLLAEHRGELKLLGQAAAQRTFADTLASLIWEFKTYGIAPEQVAAAGESLGATPLAAKLHDLALLYEAFEDFLRGRYTDPEDCLRLLAAKIPAATLTRGAEVWVDGFEWFTPQEYAVLEALLLAAQDVTVTLCLDEPDAPHHADETTLFHRSWKTRQSLRKLAARLGVSCREEVLTIARRFQAPILAHVERYAADARPPVWTGDKQGLTIAEAANRRTEVEGIARDMIRLCRDEGYRWRDMAVLLRDTDSYADLVETVLADYDIPFFSDRQRPAVHHPLAELIRSALEVVTERWAYEPVFRCLKTDLFPLSRDEIDLLENYVLEFGIRGSRWTKDEPWTFVRRLSLDEDAEPDERQQAYLDRINAIRRRAVQPLMSFEQALTQAATVRDMTAALYTLLADLDVPATLEKWATAASAARDPEQEREHRQMWHSIVDLFDQIVDTCGEQKMTLADYAAVVNEGLEGLAFSLIPPGLDHVTITPLTRARLAAKVIYLPGVNDGVLPKRGREEGLLSDRERAELASLGLELGPTREADVFAEQFVVYTALTRASDRLWVSFPLADAEGKALAPSLIVRRLKELSGIDALKPLPVEPPAGAEDEYIVHPRRSLAALAAGLRPALAGQPVGKLWRDLYNWAVARPDLAADLQRVVAGLFHSNQEQALPPELARRLYGKQGKLRGSVTRFEGFRACPFQHFARYGLALKERAVAQLKAPDFGQFFHAALRQFGLRVEKELTADNRRRWQRWGDVKDEEIGPLCEAIVQELAPKLQNEILLSSAQYRSITRRLQRTLQRTVTRLVRLDRRSRFKPVALEQAFGRDGAALPALTLTLRDGTELELVGQIDRLDMAEHKGRRLLAVIDYKAGGAWLRLPDVYHGLRLQLLTYLLVALRHANALCGEGEYAPAAVLYCYIKNPKVSAGQWLPPEEVEKEINKQLKLPGWLLDDVETVRLWEPGLVGYAEFLKVCINKDETFRQNTRVYVKTEEQFALLLRHVQAQLTATAEAILAGEVAIRPYALKGRTPCGNCRYRPVCQFDRLLADNDFVQLPDLGDEEIWARLAAEKGEEA
ncbi:helicase-exonuclease AddAB subunit AddB [Sporolituus thermophilus]|uniref:ATP-dependent helicase/deoxyribonuclease subunit B n=1 Tax=Sporolituus thermophilus DSM 23256 TaxID=1123285 RepID=A0A1G7JZ72_9FIRM|nr:helicase-exonuclease AddAB subunit AddB [Sporolituus thermophilus]SDF30144.1 DNA helicase/exodeoxyribonuclease V, subunit B [Sporolituus thermophilus DSM 23256]